MSLMTTNLSWIFYNQGLVLQELFQSASDLPWGTRLAPENFWCCYHTQLEEGIKCCNKQKNIEISLDMFREELEILLKFTFKESLCVSKFTTLNIKQLPVGERGGRGTLLVGRMGGGKYYFWEGEEKHFTKKTGCKWLESRYYKHNAELHPFDFSYYHYIITSMRKRKQIRCTECKSWKTLRNKDTIMIKVIYCLSSDLVACFQF